MQPYLSGDGREGDVRDGEGEEDVAQHPRVLVVGCRHEDNPLPQAFPVAPRRVTDNCARSFPFPFLSCGPRRAILSLSVVWLAVTSTCAADVGDRV